MAISLGLDVVKFFPAEQAGGINMTDRGSSVHTDEVHADGRNQR